MLADDRGGGVRETRKAYQHKLKQSKKTYPDFTLCILLICYHIYYIICY